MANFRKLGEEELQKAAGGQGGYDRIHDLSCFIQRTVCNVVQYDSTACLTLRRSPNGEIIPGYGWQNGDPILVHGSYSESCCLTELYIYSEEKALMQLVHGGFFMLYCWAAENAAKLHACLKAGSVHTCI